MRRKQIFVRSSITVALPFILIWAFVEVLCREMRSGLRFAWLEVRANVEAYHREMEREDY
jgi:hypothetical protein